MQLNDGVMFDLGDGAQDYPQYDDASLLNTNAAFDFAQFDKMMVDAKAAQVRAFFSLLTSFFFFFFFSSSCWILDGFFHSLIFGWITYFKYRRRRGLRSSR